MPIIKIGRPYPICDSICKDGVHYLVNHNPPKPEEIEYMEIEVSQEVYDELVSQTQPSKPHLTNSDTQDEERNP